MNIQKIKALSNFIESLNTIYINADNRIVSAKTCSNGVWCIDDIHAKNLKKDLEEAITSVLKSHQEAAERALRNEIK